MLKATWCVICYSSCNSKRRGRGGFRTTEQKKVEEVPKRFFEFLGRHLGVGASGIWEEFSLEEAMNRGMSACGECLKVMEGFCEDYGEMKRMELYANWRLWTMKNKMDGVGSVPERMELSLDDDMTDMVAEFKKRLIKQCSRKLLNSFPKVKISVDKSEQKDNEVRNEAISSQSRSNSAEGVEVASSFSSQDSGSCDDSEVNSMDKSTNLLSLLEMELDKRNGESAGKISSDPESPCKFVTFGEKQEDELTLTIPSLARQEDVVQEQKLAEVKIEVLSEAESTGDIDTTIEIKTTTATGPTFSTVERSEAHQKSELCTFANYDEENPKNGRAVDKVGEYRPCNQPEATTTGMSVCDYISEPEAIIDNDRDGEWGNSQAHFDNGVDSLGEGNAKVEPKLEIEDSPRTNGHWTASASEVNSDKTVSAKRTATEVTAQKKKKKQKLLDDDTEPRPFSCPDCDSTFLQKRDLILHQTVSHPPEWKGKLPKDKPIPKLFYRFKCPDCCKLFRYVHSLLLHRRKFHESHSNRTTGMGGVTIKILSFLRKPSTFLDEQGSLRFETFANIEVPEKVYMCKKPKCSLPFYSKGGLEAHSKLHGKFKCAFCEQEKKYAPNLAKHETVHVNEEGKEVDSTIKASCARCGLTFPSKEKYVQHHLEEHLSLEVRESGCAICESFSFGPSFRKNIKKGFEHNEALSHYKLMHNKGNNRESGKINRCKVEGCNFYLAGRHPGLYKLHRRIGHNLRNRQHQNVMQDPPRKLVTRYFHQ